MGAADKLGKNIFISYRHANLDSARFLYEQLVEAGYNVFIDIVQIVPGDRLDLEIFEAIEASAHFILLLSPGMLERCKDNPTDWIYREIEHAIKHKRHIVPVFIGNPDYNEFNYLPEEMAIILKHTRAMSIAHLDRNQQTTMDLRELLIGLEQDVSTVTTTDPSQRLLSFQRENAKRIAHADVTNPLETQDFAVEVFCSLGVSAYRDRRLTEAKDYQLMALRINAKYSYAHYNLGLIYFELGDHDTASYHLREALSVNRTLYEAMTALGNIEQELALRPIDNDIYWRRLRAAETHYKRALAIHDHYVPALMGMGNLFMQMNDYPNAREYYEQVRAIDDDDHRVYLALGKLHFAQKDYYAALTELEHAKQLNNQDGAVHEWLGYTLDELGRYAEALDAYDRALRRRHYRARLFNNKGVLHYRRGEREAACEAFRHAVEIDPTFSAAQHNINMFCK